MKTEFIPWDRIVIINRDDRPDRWERTMKELSKSKLISSREIIRFPAVTPKDCRSPFWAYFDDAHDKHNRDAVWCCRESHIRVMGKAIADGVQHLLKLEDDINISSDFDELFLSFWKELPDDFKGYQLSGVEYMPQRAVPGLKECVRNLGTWCTDFLAYSAAGLQRAYDHILWNPKQNIDQVHQTLYREVPGYYRPRTFFAQQCESHSDLTGKIANPGRPDLS